VNPPEPDHRVTEIPNLALLEAKLLPRLPDRIERLPDLLVSSVDAALNGGGTGRKPFGIGGGRLEEAVDVPPVPGFDRA
jgi:hypothetical protein